MARKSGTIRILVINGPNLNLLGEREPGVYGRKTLPEIQSDMRLHCKGKPVRLRFFQSNHEGAIVDCIHRNRKWAHGMVINPGALTHYSYSLRDAIAAVGIPAVEVHLSDIRKREPFRRISVTRPVCIGQISGKGPAGYLAGIDLLLKNIYCAGSGPESRRNRNTRLSVSATRLRKPRKSA
ncbi:type II 3-dehydroquinate dehydratase [bacterium]|nr:type II 3-dehydroquinate dehydratase [bacterium]